jgi:hypothetical protein
VKYHVAIPIAAGVLLLSGTALALRAKAKKKKAAEAAQQSQPRASGSLSLPLPSLSIPTFTPSAPAPRAPAPPPAFVPGVFDLPPAPTPAPAPSPAAQQAAVQQMQEIVVQAGGTPGVRQARVTTNDPAPAGDLIVRSAPSATAPQIGGADKDAIVNVLRDLPGTEFAEIETAGGRWKAVKGFARKKFLVFI